MAQRAGGSAGSLLPGSPPGGAPQEGGPSVSPGPPVRRSVMGTAEGEAPPASLPPLRPALLTVAQIPLLEIHSQLNRKARREQRGVIQHLVTGAPSGLRGAPAPAVAHPGPAARREQGGGAATRAWPLSWEGDLGACRPPSAEGGCGPSQGSLVAVLGSVGTRQQPALPSRWLTHGACRGAAGRQAELGHPRLGGAPGAAAPAPSCPGWGGLGAVPHTLLPGGGPGC